MIAFDLVRARAHARLGANLARRGITVGTHDLMIGATAVARGFSIVTRDRRSFPRIPGLEVEALPWLLRHGEPTGPARRRHAA